MRLPIAVLAVLAVLFTAPAVASATEVTFESPALNDGTAVDSQFKASHGVTFTGSALPRIEVTNLARSASRAINVNTTTGVEFPPVRMRGEFDRRRTEVSLYVRVKSAGLFSRLRLEALDVNGAVIAESGAGFTRVEGSSGWIQLRASQPSGQTTPAIAGFRLINEPGTNGVTVLVDDLFFDDPVNPPPPDFALTTSEEGALVVPQGTSRSRTIRISRLDGSSGGILFSATDLPEGVTASFSPNPAAGSGTSVVMTLTASASARTFSVPWPIVITGNPQVATAGASPRSTQVRMTVPQPIRLDAVGTPTFELAPCESAEITMILYREPGITQSVGLSAERDDGSRVPAPVPADLDISFAPAVLSGSASATRMRIERRDAEGDQSVSMRARASAGGGLPDATQGFGVRRLPPSLSHVPSQPTVPQGLIASAITIFGRGFCPGTRVEFGNSRASAPLTQIQPVPNRPGELQARVEVPRLATDGPLTLITPGGLRASSPDLDVRAYRDTYGFSFENDAWNGGAFRDYQELFGPEQTNLTHNPCWPFDCTITTPIPDPVFWLLHHAANAGLEFGNGTCFGFTVGHRRIAERQMSWANEAPGKVLDVDKDDDRIWGRDDIPAKDQIRIPVSRWLDIQHIAQLSAEALRIYYRRLRAYRIGNAELLRRDLEAALRNGRRPSVSILQLDSITELAGHAVTAYDLEPREGGGFFIRVYDNNIPYAGEGGGDGLAHEQREQESRIEVRPDGSWSYPHFPHGDDDEPGPWSGDAGSLMFITPETELPRKPTTPSLLDSLVTLIVGRGSASEPSGPAATGADQPILLPLLDVPNAPPAAIMPTSAAHAVDLEADGEGRQHVTFFGDGALADVEADAAPGSDGRILIGKGGDGFRYRTQAAKSRLHASLFAQRPKVTRMAEITTTSYKGGGDKLAFDRSGKKLVYGHDGPSTAVRIELGGYENRGVGQFAGSIRIGDGEKLRVAPKWAGLGSRLRATVEGPGGARKVSIRNRARQSLRISGMDVSARRKGSSVLVRLRARLAGKVRGATASGGVVIQSGKRVVGKAGTVLGGGKAARKAVLEVPLRKAGGRQLRVRANVVALGAQGASASATKRASAKVKRK